MRGKLRDEILEERCLVKNEEKMLGKTANCSLLLLQQKKRRRRFPSILQTRKGEERARSKQIPIRTP